MCLQILCSTDFSGQCGERTYLMTTITLRVLQSNWKLKHLSVRVLYQQGAKPTCMFFPKSIRYIHTHNELRIVVIYG